MTISKLEQDAQAVEADLEQMKDFARGIVAGVAAFFEANGHASFQAGEVAKYLKDAVEVELDKVDQPQPVDDSAAPTDAAPAVDAPSDPATPPSGDPTPSDPAATPSGADPAAPPSGDASQSGDPSAEASEPGDASVPPPPPGDGSTAAGA